MKWWQSKNDHKGFLGVTHAIVNILTEALRIVFDKFGLHYEIKGHDLAYWVSHIIWIGFGIYLLYVILEGTGHPIQSIQ